MGAINFSLDEELLKFFIESLDLEVFVETGTFKGDTLNIAKQYFNTCYSDELSPELYEKAVERFRDEGHVHLSLGPSPEFIGKIADSVRLQPTLFWLDAHWCVATGTAGHDSQTPLIEEIRAIGQLHQNSVLLIDDARLYLSTPPAPHAVSDWPDIHDVASELFQLSSDHRISVFDDIIAFYPSSIKASLSNYIHTTAADWLLIANQFRFYHNLRFGRIMKYLIPLLRK